MRRFIAIGLAVCFAAMAIPALAVSTSHWNHENEADFKAGTMKNVVVTNLGDVKLSRALQSIKEQDPDVTTVNALVQASDGTIYAGTGPKGILLAIKDDKVTTAAKIDGAVNILCLGADDQGAILVGTGGAKGQILKIAKPGDAPKEIFSAPQVQYIWAIQRTADGNLYAATGPNGQVFEIKPDGTNSELYKSTEDNITAMISDGHDLLYLGTDPNGTVVRLNRTTKESFVMFNAGETEITSLALDDSGNLFASTGQAVNREQQPPAEAQPKEKTGRPTTSSGETIPAKPAPPAPKPPAPNPTPGEPKPIPKSPTTQQSMVISDHYPLLMDDGGDNGPPGGDNGDNNNAAEAQAAQTPAHGPTPPANQPATPGPEGNAIYKIDKDGFVTEVFRQNVVIYSMIAQQNILLVGTGDEGQIFQVNPSAEETIVLAKTDAKQVMCLLPTKDGRVFVGLANAGGISAMTGGYATSGTYTSAVLDATQVSRFGNMQLHGQLPDGTSLKVAARSGNVKDAQAAGWGAWSNDVDATEFTQITTPPARFLQYRLTFATTDPAKTPLVDHIDVAYQIPNLAPVIKSIKISGGSSDSSTATATANQAASTTAAKTAQGTATQTISWEASDPNNDTLIYSLYFRVEQTGPWIMLKDSLKDTSFEWDTRTVADGRYQVKVVASDAPSNPPGQEKVTSRISDYIVVDNTPPTLGDLDVKITGNQATISVRAQDQTSIVASVDYTIDSGADWQSTLPTSNIFDSQDATVVFTVKGLDAGDHQVTVRATDSHGNQGIRSVSIKIAGDAATQP